MCLAIPGKVISVSASGADAFRTGQVSFDGVIRTINLSLVPEAGPGDYVLVHVGAAIARVDEAAAEQTLSYRREMGEMDDTVYEESNY